MYTQSIGQENAVNERGSGDQNLGSSIYDHLAAHQRNEEWVGRSLAEALQYWTKRFIAEFELDIPELALRVERMPISQLGHFRPEHNGFGLRGEIAINARHAAGPDQVWRILGVLLVQLLHAWQQAHGTPAKRGHHNRELRDKAESLGIYVTEKGLIGFAAESCFKRVLRGDGIKVPDEEIPVPMRRPRGNSKQKKWSCGCTNVWCAVAEFHAQCLQCAQVFRRIDSE